MTFGSCRGMLLHFLVVLTLLFFTLPTRALTLENGSDRVPLAGHISFFHDSSGKMSFDQVVGETIVEKFKPLPGNVSMGYIKGNVWLRFEVSRNEDAPAQWWLEIPNPLIDEVSLFVPTDGTSTTGSSYAELKAGEQILTEARDSIVNRQAVFALLLPEGQRQTLYLRLSSVNALVTQPSFWARQAFVSASSREDLFFGGLFGLLIVITFTGFLVGGTVRDRGILASAGFNISLLLILLPNEGYLQFYLFPNYPRVPDALIGVGLALNFIVGWELLVSLGGLGAAAPRVAKHMRWVIYTIAVPVALAALAGHYGEVAPLMQLFGHIEGSAIILISLILVIRGNQDAKIFIIPYATYIILSLSRLGRNLGWLPANLLTEHGFHLAVLIQSVSLAVIATYRLHRLRSEREEAQTKELLLSKRNEQELENRVQERTVALRRSMEDQRHLLSMVAHEFRNPLAVVDGAAQNIARGIGGSISIQQIRRAVDRMSQLLVNVLAEDRLTDNFSNVEMRQIDLVALARDCVDFHASASGLSVTLHTQEKEAFISGNQYLLRILLDNIVDNAMKYAASEPIEVIIERESRPEDSPFGLWHLAVRDNGPGIPTDIDIFGKYVRGNAVAARSGAGLGLFLVARIAGLHGGSTRARRRPDQGSEIGVLLPAC
jgi:signal transduction histidine kinase